MGEEFREIPQSLRRTGSPEYFPVTLTEAKRALDLGSSTSEDAEILELIPVAVAMVEDDCQRSLAKQNWTLTMDEFPGGPIELRRPPVIFDSSADVSIQYLDASGTQQTMDPGNYIVDAKSAPGRIFPSPASVHLWPVTYWVYPRYPNVVTVTFNAGYTDEIPRNAWRAILLALKSQYYQVEPSQAYYSLIERMQWNPGL